MSPSTVSNDVNEVFVPTPILSFTASTNNRFWSVSPSTLKSKSAPASLKVISSCETSFWVRSIKLTPPTWIFMSSFVKLIWVSVSLSW